MNSPIKDIENATEKISVLLVDDQGIVAEGVRRMLASDPAINFHYVNDGKKALETAARIGPTVILQDLVMPGVDGLDLLKEYQGNPLTRTVPVIVLSSKEEPLVKQAAFEAGASDYMVKLPHGIELLARVRMHSGAYTQGLQRQTAFRALEMSQKELMETNSELVLLNHKLEEATRFKSEFFANVSHELRTPLIGVLGMAEMLSDTTLDIYQREFVDIIQTSGKTLLYIINDILDLSKVESGKLELESIPFALRDSVDPVLDLLSPMAFGKGLEIGAWIDPRIAPTVIGDVTRVRQILLNLFSNAIKFTSAGEIHLQVEPSTDSADKVHFCVEDTGSGIPPEKLDRLFRSFSQVDASTNRRFGGTGLGLAICRNLTALMGGRIWIETKVGKGTQFHFDISLPPSKGEPESGKRHDLRGKRAVAHITNARLIRLLTTWAEELALELIVSSDQTDNFKGAPVNYLIIDADHCEIQVQKFGQIKVLLLTRSKNIAELGNRYPVATVLSLPLKKSRFLQAVEAEPDGEERIQAALAGAEVDPGIADLNILVADDNAVNRRVCIAQLQKLGVREISEAEDGRQAIDTAQSQVFDLILMDVQMPLIDGLQATRQIRLSLSYSKQPRIVALTANALSEERDECLGAGMDDRLIKPVRIEDLKAALQASPKIGSTIRPPPPSVSRLPLCDEGQLDELRKVDAHDDFVAGVLQLFIEQADRLVRRIPELANDPKSLASEAHKLKGAAGYVGAVRLVHFCSAVENAAKSSNHHLDLRIVTDLKECLNASVVDYRKRLRQKR
jgi:signal transduction histidine kinase/HPt (histidine-containing phosphotransfer) domain-containing protein